MPSRRPNPNADALAALYRKRYGSMAGWDEYLATAKNADAESRRKEILAARISKQLPPFTLKTLDGKVMTQDDLKRKVAVINFWTTWCGPCVVEMPDLQELVKKYANDPLVAIVTINNDDSAEKVRRWMAEKKYTFTVLTDQSYGPEHAGSYPTTWFIGPKGVIAFEKRGWSEHLVEEFSWRIDALR
jgi:thiol-disulfide isomerase/thioredoxin